MPGCIQRGHDGFSQEGDFRGDRALHEQVVFAQADVTELFVLALFDGRSEVTEHLELRGRDVLREQGAADSPGQQQEGKTKA